MVNEEAFRSSYVMHQGKPVPFWVREYLVPAMLEASKRSRHSVTIGIDRKTGKDVVLPYDDRAEGVAIIGKTGSGKSSLLERMIMQDLVDETPALVIDPHGVLAQRVISLASSRAARRIVLLEPSATKPFGLNLLACRRAMDDDDDPVSWAADSVVDTVKKLYGKSDEYLPRLEHYLDLAARTLIPNSGTLADAPRLFREEAFRRGCLERVSDPGVREDWTLYDSLRPTDQITHIEAVVNRLSRLLRPKIIQGIVGSRETTVPFDEVLNGDTMLILSVPSERLTPQRCNFLGAMVLCALADRVFARKVTDEEPNRFHIYLDEYERFATSTTAELLTQGRKYGAGVTLAYQNLSQITDQTVRGAVRGTGTLIVLRVSRPDADEVAGEFPVTRKSQTTEILRLLDGKEPVKVPTLTPGTHLATKGHRDPLVTNAARRLFTDGEKDPPRRLVRHDKVAIPADDVLINNLFADIMYGRVSSLQERLLDILYAFGEGKTFSSSGLFSLCNKKSPYWGNLAERAYCTRWSDLDDQIEITNVRSALGSWLEAHLDQEEAFCEGLKPTLVGGISDKFRLHYDPQDPADKLRIADDNLLIFILAHAKIKHGTAEWTQEMANPKSRRRDLIDVFRERIRCIVVICNGLKKEPILVDSGQQKDHYKEVVINHPEQNQQDAQNEFASRLVNPDEDEDWIAHVKLPIGYHAVKLAPPITGGENRRQVVDVRTRSQERAKPRLQPTEQVRTEKPTSASPADTAPPQLPPPARRAPSRRTTGRPAPKHTT